MAKDKPRPTVDELFETIKRTKLPTVLVEGKNDIIFYRAIEDELDDIGVDMLPAGNKDSVLQIRKKLKEQNVSATIAFVVDNDLWIHSGLPETEDLNDLITTDGYSIENDLFSDGDLIKMLRKEEIKKFLDDLDKFCRWYALAVSRYTNDRTTPFRTHPGKILDDDQHYNECIKLNAGEEFPDELFAQIKNEFEKFLRGKSLFALLHRQLSRKDRDVKFSEKQLMEFGVSRKGDNFQRMSRLVRQQISTQD